MEFLRTEQIWLSKDGVLSTLCHLSKNLWNEANYIIRQEYFATGRYIKYNTMARTLKSSKNYKTMPAATAQQVLRILDRSWTSFFKCSEDYRINPGKYMGKPKLPGYKEKCGEFSLVFTNMQVKIRNGFMKFPKKLGIIVKTRLGDDTDVREARIIPKGTGYVLEIVYKIKKDIPEPDFRRVAGIDLGLCNIVTMANNIGEKPIVIKGGVLKSINQFYNKRRAQLQRVYELQGIRTGTAIKKLTERRNRKIASFMHQISRYVINWCSDHGIGTIVIGHNNYWKTSCNLGRRTNQNFVFIPDNQLIHDITYKAEERGINVVVSEESHTSKCSFLDNEPIRHRTKYAGKRISRGLFRSASGIVINADVNGALNIIRKAIPEAFANGIEGAGLHPERVTFKGVNRQ